MKNVKSHLYGAACALAFGFISLPSHAALVDNGGGFYYDTVLEVTWAQPAIPIVLGTWDQANAAVAALEVNGVGGWRLPWASQLKGDTPLDAFPIDCAFSTQEQCQDNELGYMYYYNLDLDPDGVPATGTDQFPELRPFDYWTGTTGTFTRGPFTFNMGDGTQKDLNAGTPNIYVWAVQDGNVSPVPLPAAVWLFGSALGLLGWRKRRAA